MGSNCQCDNKRNIQILQYEQRPEHQPKGPLYDVYKIIRIQAFCRGYIVRKQFQKQNPCHIKRQLKSTPITQERLGGDSTKDITTSKHRPSQFKLQSIKSIRSSNIPQSSESSSEDSDVESIPTVQEDRKKSDLWKSRSVDDENFMIIKSSQIIRVSPDDEIPSYYGSRKESLIFFPSLGNIHAKRIMNSQGRRNSINGKRDSIRIIEICFIPDDCNKYPVDDNKKDMLITMVDKCQYEGQWLGGKGHGNGKYIFADGSSYSGNWVCGKASGGGVYQHANGDTFTGQWQFGNIVGHGIYQYSKGVTYEGAWKNNHPNGFGKETYSTGGYYHGSFMNGLKHGEGKLVFPNGQTYQGEFCLDQMQGQGTYTWPNQKKYKGGWVNSQMDGQGVLEWVDGTKYSGEYKYDKKDGYGILKCADGSQYSGLWHNGMQHGEGEFKSCDGITKKGMWIQGRFIKSSLL